MSRFRPAPNLKQLDMRSVVTTIGILASLAFPAWAGEPPVQKDEAAHRQTARPPFTLGADISWVQEQEDEGVRFTDRNKEQNILAILKNHGFNWIRLRIFHDPKAEKGYSKKGDCDLDHTLQMAKRIKTAGMGFLLDFHYSDAWAEGRRDWLDAVPG